MADDSSVEILLSATLCILDSAVPCSRVAPRETAEGSHRVYHPPFCDHLDDWVRKFFLLQNYGANKFTVYSWSYLINLTWIGNMVFVTMDWTDVFIAVSCCRCLKRRLS